VSYYPSLLLLNPLEPGTSLQRESVLGVEQYAPIIMRG